MFFFKSRISIQKNIHFFKKRPYRPPLSGSRSRECHWIVVTKRKRNMEAHKHDTKIDVVLTRYTTTSTRGVTKYKVLPSERSAPMLPAWVVWLLGVCPVRNHKLVWSQWSGHGPQSANVLSLVCLSFVLEMPKNWNKCRERASSYCSSPES